jgi:hypothetical protein
MPGLIAHCREELLQVMREQGYVLTPAKLLADLSQAAPDQLATLAPNWEDLPLDEYLKDGGKYRRRRHSSLVVTTQSVQLQAHRAHWQPVEYNALHGGMMRWFEPVPDATVQSSVWQRLLMGLAGVCSELKPDVERWYVEAHPFRIDTTGGVGRPTPEGAHRDGVDFVAVILVSRHQIKGAETRVFDAGDGDGLTEPLRGQRFTLTEPWSMLLLDDERIIHESTPIQPLAEGAHRDTLVLTYRAGGFQGPGA